MNRVMLPVFFIALLFAFSSSSSFAEFLSNDGYVSNYDYADSDSGSAAYEAAAAQDANESSNIKPSIKVANDRPAKPSYIDIADDDAPEMYAKNGSSSSARMPHQVSGYGEKVIIVNPRVHAWAAYSTEGKLIRAGLATSGAKWCPDVGRPCKTKSGTFRIYSLGSSGCYSKRFPLGRGGAPMPYCMYFNGGQGIHGSHELARANLSHGCVRVSVSDAAWIRFKFATSGTKVIVLSY